MTHALSPHQESDTAQGENSANHAGQYYDQALGQWQTLNDPNSPNAKTFTNETIAGLQPAFDMENQNLTDKEVAMGIANSGAAKNDFTNLARAQSGVLAQALSPFYLNAQQGTQSLLSGKAGAQSGNYGQMFSQTDSTNASKQAAEQAAMNQALNNAAMAAGGG